MQPQLPARMTLTTTFQSQSPCLAHLTPLPHLRQHKLHLPSRAFMKRGRPCLQSLMRMCQWMCRQESCKMRTDSTTKKVEVGMQKNILLHAVFLVLTRQRT